jgi:hypothetical protein
MLLYTLRRRIKKNIKSTYNYYRVIRNTKKIKSGDKIIYVDVTGVAWNRYLYSFLKFFDLQGYTVFLPKNRELIDHLSIKEGEFRFSSWILDDNFVKFGNPPTNQKVMCIQKNQLSNDYFLSFVHNHIEVFEYHIPMSEFPLVYHRLNWKIEFPAIKKRKRSFFMAGNLDENLYNKIEKAGNFKIPGRVTISGFLKKKKYYKAICSLKFLEDFIEAEIDNKVVIIDTSKEFSIELEKLKTILSKFDFFLALPGIIVPQCHNIIEAMSAGCIPILHSCYAKLLVPNLEQGVNALIYNDLDELNELILSSFLLTEKEVLKLRLNCINYYRMNLTPLQVVTNIEKYKFSKIYIQAEHLSLKGISKPLS